MKETLYRFFDANDVLLYVGISNNWQQRLKQHYKDSNFHSETSYITLERFSTREEVEQAEELAIKNEKPIYNKALNPYWENPQQHLLKIKFLTYSNLEPDEEHKFIVQKLKYIFSFDPNWTRKTAGPIAYYLQLFLPEWHSEAKTNCDLCKEVYGSAQIASWVSEYRRKINANY